MSLLEVKNLGISLGKKAVLEDLTFTIQENESMALLGESGSGKTLTALSIIRLLDAGDTRIDPRSQILYKGLDLLKLSEQQMQKVRGQEIGIIFQEPMHALNPVYSIGWQMGEILRVHKKISKKAAHTESITLLEKLNIESAKDCLKAYPHQLSGGMKQRILIAMALLSSPELIIADEITTALDAFTQTEVLKVFNKIREHWKISLLFITHNIHLAKQISTRTQIMYAGQIIESGPTSEVLTNPRHPYTEALLHATPILGKTQMLRDIPLFTDATQAQRGCRFGTRCPHKRSICTQKIAIQSITKEHKIRCIR